jgi:hypothetical protein
MKFLRTIAVSLFVSCGLLNSVNAADQAKIFNILYKDVTKEILSDAEFNALKDYMENWYDTINSELRSGNPSQEVLDKTEKVRSAMNKLAWFQEKTYRGTCLPDRFYKEYSKVGNIVSDPGFMSTSKSKEIGLDFVGEGPEGCNPCFFVINGFSGADISEFAKEHFGEDSLQYEEEEVLFKNGSKFVVESVIDIPDDWFGKIKQIQLQEIE